MTSYFLGYNLRETRFSNRIASLRRRAAETGVLDALRLVSQYITCFAAYPLVHDASTFVCRGRAYPYLRSPVHTERAVEIPIAIAALQECAVPAERVLEVGNVLSAYVDFPHDIVDKYEVGPGVLNIDVVDFYPGTRYDLVLSISTLEHVGFDEPTRDLSKFEKAVNHIVDYCLRPRGRLLLTVPFRYNPAVDSWVLHRASNFGRSTVLFRESLLNVWHERRVEDLDLKDPRLAFDRKYPGAAVVIVWDFESRDQS